MTKLLILYHSIYGHIEKMAGAVAAGAREVTGTQVIIKRVPETMQEEAFEKSWRQMGTGGADCQPGGAGRLRRHQLPPS